MLYVFISVYLFIYIYTSIFIVFLSVQAVISPAFCSIAARQHSHRGPSDDGDMLYSSHYQALLHTG